LTERGFKGKWLESQNAGHEKQRVAEVSSKPVAFFSLLSYDNDKL
jgi:hypothetical protein